MIYAFLSWQRKIGGHSHSHGSDDAEHFHEHDLPEPRVESPGKCKISWGAWITAIVGIAPCFTLIPVLIVAIPYGSTTTLLVMISYAIATVGMMVILTSLAFKAIQYVTRLERVEKHMEILAGIVISLVGVWLILEISFGL